jgi:prepilin-type N-terminal cleavage/methylation domain-containing protein
MNKKGLTLVEILVAMVILSLVLSGLVNIFVGGKRYVLRARSRMTASELGKYFLGPLQMQVRQDDWGSNCLSTSPGTGCPGAEFINNITYTPVYNNSNISGTSLRKVRVTISWPSE